MTRDLTHGGPGQPATWFRQAGAFAERSTRSLFRNKTVLFWSVAFPVGFYLLTVWVFLDGASIPESALPTAKAGIAVSYGMFGAIIASLNAFGTQLAEDFDADRYRLFRSLPVASSADLGGRMVAALLLAVVAFLATVAVAVATGGTFAVRSLVSVPVVAIAFLAFALVWMVAAVLVATVVRDARYASIITVSVALAAYFLTGYNGTDPTAFQGPRVLLDWLPNTLATRLITHHVVAGGTLTVPSDAFGLAVLSVSALATLAVGVLVMRRGVYVRGVVP